MPCMVKLDDKLTLSFPDGFHVMDDAEKSGMQFYGGNPGKCLSNPECHVMISIGRKSIGGLSALLINTKDAAKRMEARIRKPMQAYGYRLNGFAAKNVGGEQAEGFGYEYESQGIDMYGESCVIRHDRTLYYLNFYARRELMSKSLDARNEILASAVWS